MAGLRLYLYYPPGSPQTQPPLVGAAYGCRTPNGCYMTGHFDDTAPPGAGCLNADPQAFDTLASMIAYAAAHGERLYQVQSDAQVNQICSQGLPGVTPTPPVQTPIVGTTVITQQPFQSGAPTGGPPAAGPGTVTSQPTASTVATTTATLPSQTPQTAPSPSANPIYRFGVKSTNPATPNGYETGANYPGCSSANPSACQPMSFNTAADFLYYAQQHSEIPVLVSSSDEAFGYVNNPSTVPQNQIITGVDSSGNPVVQGGLLASLGSGLPLLLIGGLAVSFLFGKKTRKAPR